MSKLLARHFWITHVLFILIASWLSTRLVAIIIQDRLTNLPIPIIAQSPSNIPAQAIPYQKYSLVVERNIFNPSEKGLKLLPLGEVKTTPESESGGSEISQAESLSTYRLVGTITGPGIYSYAIFQEGASKKQSIYGLHEKIGEGEIISIFRDRVVIRIKGKLETLALATRIEKEVPPTGRRISSAPKEEPVRRLSANHFLINREDVMASVGNINQFMTQALFRPYFAMGRPAGYIISEIVPGSLFEKIGLRNNDIVKKINGQMINQPEEVFQAYSQLLSDSRIEVEIERGGRTEVFRYEIR